MLATISKTVALKKVKYLIDLLGGYNPHHPHTEYKDDIIKALDKLHDIFESPKQK